jgi:hypothetical protein
MRSSNVVSQTNKLELVAACLSRACRCFDRVCRMARPGKSCPPATGRPLTTTVAHMEDLPASRRPAAAGRHYREALSDTPKRLERKGYRAADSPVSILVNDHPLGHSARRPFKALCDLALAHGTR